MKYVRIVFCGTVLYLNDYEGYTGIDMGVPVHKLTNEKTINESGSISRFGEFRIFRMYHLL